MPGFEFIREGRWGSAGVMALAAGLLLCSISPAALAEPGICRPGEVTFVGGALACPTCQDAAADYQPDPKYSDEVNGQMKKALADDLEAAKWLMAYFSDPAHKDYAEAKKWFGRALGIGAPGKELRLPDGYDEPYLSVAVFEFKGGMIKMVSSCVKVDSEWQPRCYAQTLYYIDATRKIKTDLSIFNLDYQKHNVLATSITAYIANGSHYVVLNFEDLVKKRAVRQDYLKDGGYIGSSSLPGNSNMRLIWHRNYTKFDYGPGIYDKQTAFKSLPETTDRAAGAEECQEVTLDLYPIIERVAR